MAPLLTEPAPRAPAAVVGATGFIGSRLVPGLRAAMVPTHAFGRHTPLTPGGRLADGLREARTVFYLATRITPAVAEEHPELVEADRSAFVGLLKQLGRTGTRPTVVLTSSGGTAYDPAFPPPYSEESPVRATSRYGRAKLLLEQELLARADVIRPVVLRLANVYGPGQRSCNGLGVVPHWLEAIADGRPVVVLGDPGTSRDYVYVDDTVQALIRVHLVASEPGGPGRDALPSMLNVGSGEPVSLKDLLSVITEVVGFEPLVEHRERRSFDRHAAWLDVTRARSCLGWRPRTPLETGVSEAWGAMRTDLARTRPQNFSRR
ncbi:NAD-dependent epimerase/dehydratase family protein [Sphaerisporangium sp. TRM90804]|uniref:NAD-dependent epimerase/dehydratase family protein n=1 Tax=Sphaerisporangium sp. TRM90804 TaxID=3031113 RepID=UPI002449C23D|nr:NAD-dependent epimerase/dehydratase family protein [Sphaerisporangium sp. TRM90804]MDH2427193.1 NAD-dependent epimerase/dehydratase family protein [Sphaerisporangium sp. TRM90804]